MGMARACTKVRVSATAASTLLADPRAPPSRAITQWCTLIRDVHDLPGALDEAFAHCVERPPWASPHRPPKDVSAARLQHVPDVKLRIASRMAEKAALQRETGGMSQAQCARIAGLINNAQRPIIYAGQGVAQAGAVAELRQLAAQGDIPVTTSLLGMGSFDET